MECFDRACCVCRWENTHWDDVRACLYTLHAGATRLVKGEGDWTDAREEGPDSVKLDDGETSCELTAVCGWYA